MRYPRFWVLGRRGGPHDDAAPESRTALVDAVYLGVDKLKQARYDRKALLILSDGGDNRSRYTEVELRNRYVVGYPPSEVKKDGNWRKLKVRLIPPPGFPELTVHYRQGYYAPSQ